LGMPPSGCAPCTTSPGTYMDTVLSAIPLSVFSGPPYFLCSYRGEGDWTNLVPTSCRPYQVAGASQVLQLIPQPRMDIADTIPPFCTPFIDGMGNPSSGQFLPPSPPGGSPACGELFYTSVACLSAPKWYGYTGTFGSFVPFSSASVDLNITETS
jgi:hypothetical protein